MTSMDKRLQFGTSIARTFAASILSPLQCTGVDGYSWTTLGPIAVGVALVIAASIPRSSLTSEPEPLPRLEYDFGEIGDYFAQRPVAVATRSAVVAFEALWWLAGRFLLISRLESGEPRASTSASRGVILLSAFNAASQPVIYISKY